MPALGAPELIIILVIIILIFGVGKLPEVGSALGKGIREFRGAAEASDDKDKKDEAAKPAPPVVEAPRPVAAVDAPLPTTVAPPTAASQAAPVGTAPTTAPVAPSPLTGSAPATIAYTVQTGDTLDTIAQRHGISVDALMAANGYSNRDRVLYPGDKIQVPTATTPA
ncbi:MAG: twin-arginine translocase TatA/TatE family subunit [Chloroflexota bacterium]|nr:twin-arginine translocase TatA/TatE family subunit [Chloroflexota bacterium]